MMGRPGGICWRGSKFCCCGKNIPGAMGPAPRGMFGCCGASGKNLFTPAAMGAGTAGWGPWR